MPLELKPGAPEVAADQPFGVVGVAAAQRVDEKLMLAMDAVPALGEKDSRRRLAALAGAVPWPPQPGGATSKGWVTGASSRRTIK
jgi:hypothetical protein